METNDAMWKKGSLFINERNGKNQTFSQLL